MTINISSLWDFNNPELSEERFRSALASASAEDALILQTQIARTYGLRNEFDHAQKLLAEIELQMHNASDEVKARFYLELGRTYSSAAHAPEAQTSEAKEQARSAFLTAFEAAKKGKLDGLAIDALHMMSFVESEPEKQVEWNSKAIEVMKASMQEEAKKWAGALYNNNGYAKHQLGKYEEALADFELALSAYQQGGDPQSIRIAYWMIAWTLRFLDRLNEALDIQLRLEKECDQAGEPDVYVYEELELLYQALGNEEKAVSYAKKRQLAG